MRFGLGDSNVLLDVAKYVLHMIVLGIRSMRVVVRAAPVPVRSCWEFHVHYWRMLIREIL